MKLYCQFHYRRNFLPLLYQFVDLELKSPMAFIRKKFSVLKFPMSFQKYQQRFQNRLETEFGIYKGPQKYKFYLQFAVQSVNLDIQCK